MKAFAAYLALFTFVFFSLTPSGIAFTTLFADELDDLDLGLEEEDEEDSLDETVESSSESEEASSGIEERGEEFENGESRESGEDSLSETSDKKRDDFSAEDEFASAKKKIAAFYLFADSFSKKSAGRIAAETASYLGKSEGYDYFKTESELFASSASITKSDLESAAENLKEGKALYANLDIESAIEKLQNALRYVEKRLDSSIDMNLLGEILLYLGVSNKMLDEDELATQYFATYISINPDAVMDDMIFSPDMVSFFNEVKDEFISLPKGSVKVESAPSGALVFIDGKAVDVTPAVIRKISEGRHYYRIHKNGFRDIGGSFSVKEGKTAIVNGTLTKYSSASSVIEAEKEMKEEYGHLSMLRKSVELADEMQVDMLLVTHLTVEGKTVKYIGHLVDKEKRSFKKVETSFVLPERGQSSKKLNQFHQDLLDDSYGFKAISDLAMEEATLLGLTEEKPAEEEPAKEIKKGKPIYKEWWLWTIVGAVVLTGVGVGTYYGVKANSGGGGGTLDLNFK